MCACGIRCASARLLEGDTRDALAGLTGDDALCDGRVALAVLAAAVEALGILPNDQEIERAIMGDRGAVGRRLAYRSNSLRSARMGLRYPATTVVGDCVAPNSVASARRPPRPSLRAALFRYA